MAEIMTGEEAMTASKTFLELYRMGEACEHAFIKYRLALTEKGDRSLEDEKTLCAALDMFYGANSQDELDACLSMTPAELVAKHAEILAKYESAQQ